MKMIIRLLVTAAVAFILAQILAGEHVAGYGTAIWFAIVLALLHVFLKPFLIILTISVLLASEWVEGFEIDSFGWGLLFSLLVTAITSFLFREEDRQRKEYP